ncbi:MAG: Fur family transcriptional regulator [Anaerolineae bacterium]|jgi:Fe2+ or Zn2+ uptake regulation protein|nr:transcriptional repressor [Chloroflexota bacterium]
MACQTIFQQRLREHKMRLTAQRSRILDVLHQVTDFATAEEILRLALAAPKGERPVSLDISTVYRTLELLRALDLVVALDLGDGTIRYELVGAGSPHLHLVCQGCGALSVAPMESVDALLQQLAQRHGFRASLEDVTIPGLCAACQAANREGDGAREPVSETRGHPHSERSDGHAHS